MSRSVVTDATVVSKPNRCLVPVDQAKGLMCAKLQQQMMGIDPETPIAEAIPHFSNGEFKWVSASNERVAWDLPLSDGIKLFFSPPKVGDVKVTGKYSVPVDEFQDALNLVGPKTPRAKALADIYAVIGPDGTTLKKLASEDVWHDMTAVAAKHAIVKKLSVKRNTKTGDIKDQEQVPEMEQARLERLRTDLRDAMEPSVKTSFSYKPAIKYHYNKKSGEMESVQFEFSVTLFAQLPSGQTRTDSETSEMTDGMHPESPLRSWILSNPDMTWKANVHRSIATLEGDKTTTWADIFKCGNQWDQVDLIGTIRIVPYRVSMSKDYAKYVSNPILDNLTIYNVIGRSKRKAAALSDEQAALYDELLADSKRQRLDEDSNDGAASD